MVPQASPLPIKPFYNLIDSERLMTLAEFMEAVNGLDQETLQATEARLSIAGIACLWATEIGVEEEDTNVANAVRNREPWFYPTSVQMGAVTPPAWATHVYLTSGI